MSSTKPELSGLSPDLSTLVDHVRDTEVAIGVVRGLVELVAGMGVDRQEFVRAAGLDGDRLDASDARVGYATLGRAVDLALDMTGNEMLGLRWARALTERTFVPISHLISHTRTLAESFQLLARYYYLITNRRAFEVVADQCTATIRYLPLEGEPDRHRRFGADMTIGSLFRFIRSFNSSAKPGRASFAHIPSNTAEYDVYERFFGGQVRFGCDASELMFERGILDQPSPQRDDEVREALREVVEQRLMRIDQSTGWAARVREHLTRGGPGRPTDMGTVARAMGVSARTLRRRLAAEGYGYDQVVTEARRDAAIRMLRAPALSIQEIAYRLGFSSASAFHRAFKRWTGMTPTVYRERRDCTENS